MITVTEKDIGKTVVYKPPHSSQHALGGFKSADAYVSEEGVITGLSGLGKDGISSRVQYVYVRYGDEPNPRVTHPKDLNWKTPC